VRVKLPNKNILLYYISGTGNSYRISEFLEDTSIQKGLNAKRISIKESNAVQKLKQVSYNLIGLVFPTHGFTMPWSIFKFVLKLPKSRGAHTFVIATRGSFKFGKVYFPGMSGSATFVVSLILFMKGYNVRGAMSVNMPSNWFTLHPIQNTENHQRIVNRAEKRVSDFLNKIVEGNKVWFTLNNLYEFTGGILLSYISLLYLLVGRFFLAKLFFTNEDCDACEVCVKNCSFEALEMRGKKNPLPFWKYNCESCMRCAAFCPKNAIESGQSWGVLLYFISTIPLIAYGINWLNSYIPGIDSVRNTFAYDILDFLYYYPAIFISYILIHSLMRIPPIRWLFSHTTFTHLKKWGRYKEPKIKLKNLHNQKEKKYA
jgi:ferredoxin